MKAILVIDMPTNCRGCDKLVRKGCLKGDYRKDERPKQCPLRPLPEKREVKTDFIGVGDYDFDDIYNAGFNSCIDEITGKEE